MSEKRGEERRQENNQKGKGKGGEEKSLPFLLSLKKIKHTHYEHAALENVPQAHFIMCFDSVLSRDFEISTDCEARNIGKSFDSLTPYAACRKPRCEPLGGITWCKPGFCNSF